MDLSTTSTATRDQATEAIIALITGDADRETIDRAYTAMAVGDYDGVLAIETRDAAVREAQEIWLAIQKARARARAGRGLEG